MADPPRPRSPGQPPPLPPQLLRSIEHPFRDLTVPLTLEERAADTERSGPRRDEIPPPALDMLTETTAQLLRRELALTRETLPTLPAMASPSLPPPSKARQATSAVVALGKYTAIATGIIGLAVQIATIWRPDLVGPLQVLGKLLGSP